MESFFEPIFIRKYKAIESELTIDKRLQTLCAISALVSMGNHDFLKSYFEYALSETLDLEEIHEVILQTYLFAGFPAAIEGFIVLKRVQENDFNALHVKAENNISKWRDEGMKLFKTIYSDKSEKVKSAIEGLNPDFADWMIFEGYGKTLSRTGLKAATRELCAISSLAVNSWERQLFSHCIGAINCGATKDDVKSALLIAELFKKDVFKKYSYIIERI